MSGRRRVAALAVAGPCLGAGLAGCQNGFHPEVDLVQPSFGSYAVGDVHVGSPVLVRAAVGTAAALTAGLVNDGAAADELSSVEMDLDHPPTASAANIAGGMPLPVTPIGEVFKVDATDHKVVFTTAGHIPLGVFAAVTFHFRDAGVLTVPVLVMPPSGWLAGLAPSPGAGR